MEVKRNEDCTHYRHSANGFRYPFAYHHGENFCHGYLPRPVHIHGWANRHHGWLHNRHSCWRGIQKTGQEVKALHSDNTAPAVAGAAVKKRGKYSWKFF